MAKVNYLIGEDEFLACCGSTEFAKQMAAASPFPSLDQAIVAARDLWFNKVFSFLSLFLPLTLKMFSEFFFEYFNLLIFRSMLMSGCKLSLRILKSAIHLHLHITPPLLSLLPLSLRISLFLLFLFSSDLVIWIPKLAP